MFPYDPLLLQSLMMSHPQYLRSKCCHQCLHYFTNKFVYNMLWTTYRHHTMGNVQTPIHGKSLSHHHPQKIICKYTQVNLHARVLQYEWLQKIPKLSLILWYIIQISLPVLHGILSGSPGGRISGRSRAAGFCQGEIYHYSMHDGEIGTSEVFTWAKVTITLLNIPNSFHKLIF